MSTHPTYGTIVQSSIPKRHPFTTMSVMTSNGYTIEVVPRDKYATGWENIISIVNVTPPKKVAPIKEVASVGIMTTESLDDQLGSPIDK